MSKQISDWLAAHNHFPRPVLGLVQAERCAKKKSNTQEQTVTNGENMNHVEQLAAEKKEKEKGQRIRLHILLGIQLNGQFCKMHTHLQLRLLQMLHITTICDEMWPECYTEKYEIHLKNSFFF